ncbi:hypothetical protein FEM48_Zijuj01G0202800 [Ziziphus jujuba var. spinosa]|uniref:Uncharacterized protein n=1 Tax=Ziziphus jujuba var. spinosa TaxID=714518 RepID=A0A978W3C3_ZIZJJ|nr:hypothetical protein FEM48_Zijuj01G0202800 [Ziziphus jujuba var. spinosa]
MACLFLSWVMFNLYFPFTQRYLMLGSPLASISIPGAQGHCLSVCFAVRTHKFDISNVLYLVSLKRLRKKKENKKKIGYERDGIQPDDEMHAILGGPINEEE